MAARPAGLPRRELRAGRELSSRQPAGRRIIPGASYLAWIDISRYLPNGIPLTRFFF
jgi:hypothetical protein